VYEALWERVQMEPMNKDEVTPAYDVRLPLMCDGHSLSRGSPIFDLCFNVDKLQLRRRKSLKVGFECVDHVLAAAAAMCLYVVSSSRCPDEWCLHYRMSYLNVYFSRL
jgi:hypothetical protein